ncbi:hypothetical protein IscW_ISCW012001 [Ixodes scapularis]|uniref:Uncharacterized protein n=1 Tax=Ixodes scapularis TaxID=6945 RepID=B7QB98_IXOSC|nr:hypothetical protein IscW_ISCW012001 [Ixodes scapularis]|eukprot:XP_002412824.1 hypothetical protein IscW_ISCW012001 [Ixodes scapularis]
MTIQVCLGKTFFLELRCNKSWNCARLAQCFGDNRSPITMALFISGTGICQSCQLSVLEAAKEYKILNTTMNLYVPKKQGSKTFTPEMQCLRFKVVLQKVLNLSEPQKLDMLGAFSLLVGL